MVVIHSIVFSHALSTNYGHAYLPIKQLPGMKTLNLLLLKAIAFLVSSTTSKSQQYHRLSPLHFLALSCAL